MAENFTVASMFAGCGGLDLGFQGGFRFLNRNYCRLPFEIVWANEIDEKACDTYDYNFKHKITRGDIIDRIGCMPCGVDVIIGGFPCQDISINNIRAKGINGSRSNLYQAMVKAVARCQPKVFVAENVRALLFKNNTESLSRILKDFGSAGYDVSIKLYNAADYGVPQTRERVFIVGSRVGEFSHPNAVLEKSSWITASQAIDDLAGLRQDGEWSHWWSTANISPEQGNRRLVANRPGFTVRAEHHGNSHFHYRLQRRISTREAARLQSFPDSFIFRARMRQTERQIGNAVPPVLAWHIASALRGHLIERA